MIDLNTLTAPGSPYLLYAGDINDSGEIVGEAYVSATGGVPAYVATPMTGATDTMGSQTGADRGPPMPAGMHDRIERRAFGRLGADPLRN
jgi:hypothetical protein